MMHYVTLNELKERLESVPKAIIIKMLHNQVAGKTSHEIEIMVLDNEILLNLQQQEEVREKMYSIVKNHRTYAPPFGWFEHLNHDLKKLDKEYQRLDKQKEQLQQTN